MSVIGVLSVIFFIMISTIRDKNKCVTMIILILCVSWHVVPIKPVMLSQPFR